MNRKRLFVGLVAAGGFVASPAWAHDKDQKEGDHFKMMDTDGDGKISAEEHADLVIIATHGWSGWRRLVFGSVAERVLRESTCAVLSIRCSEREAKAT